ncbi:hypothetical protein ANRL1_00932 [Anaerolineae bacterium]|nr:hypothetical protein ANRL1_00932 [Anaerolineae bacterium]
METFKLPVDTIYGRREVEFYGRMMGRPLVQKTDDNTQGVTETEYEVENQRRIIHVSQWTDQPSNVQFCMIKDRVEPDIRPRDLSEPELGRSLKLDEAIALSLSLKK